MRLSLVYVPTCRWHTAAGYCGSTQVHEYPCGMRCDEHSPWARAGHPRPTTPAQQRQEQQ